MAQPVRSRSPERSAPAPLHAAPATVPATAPYVHARPQHATPFIVVKKSCQDRPDFDAIQSAYPVQAIDTLDLGGSDMRAGMWFFLLDFLEKRPASNTLNLSNCMVGARSDTTLQPFEYFLRRLTAMPSQLILRGCYIGSKFLVPIARRLKVDQNLHTLDLAKNRLLPPDIQSLADALQHNRTLSALSLAGNGLNTAAIPALSNLLANAHSVQKLDLSDNLFTPEEKTALQQANAARTSGPVELLL